MQTDTHIRITEDQVPQEVIDAAEGLDGQEVYRVEGCDFGSLAGAVVPETEYDISYTAALMDTPNAEKTRTISIGGVSCNFYERIDKTKTGYVVFSEPEANAIYYVEI